MATTNKTQTMDVLPGQDSMRTTIEHKERRRCEMCGEHAHFKRSYLLEGYRTNRASKAFGKDDASWCSDVDVFVCRDCKPETPEGYDPGYSEFAATERFAQMFLYWHVDAVNEPDVDD